MGQLSEKIVPLLEDMFAAADTGAQVFSERQLAEQLGVSRPVIREALSGLRQRGLVEILPGKGVRPLSDLQTPTISTVREFLERSEISRADIRTARMLLEPEIAALAAQNRSAEQLELLVANVRSMRENLDYIDRFETSDFSFHVELARASGNALYLLWLQPVTGYLQRTANRLSTLGEVRHRALAAHQAIVDAVAKQDAAAARAAMIVHLTDYANDTVKAIALGILPPEPEGVDKA